MSRREERSGLPIIGWREWVALPDLGVDRIKAKVDTGARSSAVHALNPERFRRKGRDWVRFGLHPLQRQNRPELLAEAELLDVRNVRSSTGQEDERLVVRTRLVLLDSEHSIELTLSRRDQMGFRMLLGREAVRRRYLVDPGGSYYDSTRVPKRRNRAR